MKTHRRPALTPQLTNTRDAQAWSGCTPTDAPSSITAHRLLSVQYSLDKILKLFSEMTDRPAWTSGSSVIPLQTADGRWLTDADATESSLKQLPQQLGNFVVQMKCDWTIVILYGLAWDANYCNNNCAGKCWCADRLDSGLVHDVSIQRHNLIVGFQNCIIWYFFHSYCMACFCYQLCIEFVPFWHNFIFF